MPYVTGSVNNYTDLRTVIFSALATNGWTTSGDIASKGDINVRLQVGNPFSYGTQEGLVASIATAVSGGVLSGSVSTQGVRVGSFDATTANAMTFPATYMIFINTDPDEIYVVLNYDITAYQWVAFGKSPAPGLTGSGVWLGGTFGASPSLGASYPNLAATVRIAMDDSNAGRDQHMTGAGLFCNNNSGGEPGRSVLNSVFHSGIGVTGGWSIYSGNMPNAYLTVTDFIVNTPNAWNGQAVLIRINPTSPYIGDGKTQIIGNIEHSRYIRISNLNPGEILTLGGDQWMVLPWYVKSATNDKDITGMVTSGWYGWALRYDGA